jgi:hypothetical protein
MDKNARMFFNGYSIGLTAVYLCTGHPILAVVTAGTCYAVNHRLNMIESAKSKAFKKAILSAIKG